MAFKLWEIAFSKAKNAGELFPSLILPLPRGIDGYVCTPYYELSASVHAACYVHG